MFVGFSAIPRILTPLTTALAVPERKELKIFGGIEYIPQVVTKLLTDTPIFASVEGPKKYQKTRYGLISESTYQSNYQNDLADRFNKCIELAQQGTLTLYGRKMSDVMSAIAVRTSFVSPWLQKYGGTIITAVATIYGSPIVGSIVGGVLTSTPGRDRKTYESIIEQVRTAEEQYRKLTEPEIRKIQILATQIPMK